MLTNTCTHQRTNQRDGSKYILAEVRIAYIRQETAVRARLHIFIHQSCFAPGLLKEAREGHSYMQP